MKLFLCHTLLLAAFVANVSAEDKFENSYMRPRSLAHKHKGRKLEDEKVPNIVEYKSSYSERPKDCDTFQKSLQYIGNHAKVETEFDDNDVSAASPLLDMVKEEMHKNMDADEADKLLAAADPKELLADMFEHINDPVDGDAGQRRLDQNKLHETWESEEEYENVMVHAEFLIETFPFEEMEDIFSQIDELGLKSHPNMTTEDVHALVPQHIHAGFEHRRMTNEEDFRAYVEARGHRFLSWNCVVQITNLIVDTICIILAIAGIGSGIAKSAGKKITQKLLRKVGKKVMAKIAKNAKKWGKKNAKKAFKALWDETKSSGGVSSGDIIDAVMDSVSWWSAAWMFAKIAVYAACLVLSGGACFVLKLALMIPKIIKWFEQLERTTSAC
jgi:hypothetical protein